MRGNVVYKMRKIYADGQDFSPQDQVFRDAIEFWKRILEQKQGVLTSQVVLGALAKCLKFPLKTPKRMSYETVQRKLTSAYKAYNLAKPNLPKWKKEFQVSLVPALASEKDRSAKLIISQTKRGKH